MHEEDSDLDINGFTTDSFDLFIIDLKSTFFSKTKFPKLIVGTGLSIAYGISGMSGLSKELEREFGKLADCESKSLWDSLKADINDKGLEEGLKGINLGVGSNMEFVNFVRNVTAKFLLNEEINKTENFYNKTGFSRLLDYLRKSASTNNPLLDIMTPNYDRIIENVCDYLCINCIDGFKGNFKKSFDASLLRHPKEFYNKQVFSVRLYKPHGSLGWILLNGKIKSVTDNKLLLENTDNIQIVTPGNAKYELALTNDTFRQTRESFNEAINQNDFSFVIFGYGFNDEHFNTVIYSKIDHVNSLIISKDIRSEVIDMAQKNHKMVLIYQIDGVDLIVYKGKTYTIDQHMWNIDVFSNVLFAE